MSAGTRWLESRGRKLVHGARVAARLGSAAVARAYLPRPTGPDPGGAVVRRVVVIATGYLGDVVLATPALQALRRALPSAVMTLVVERRVQELFSQSPIQNRLLPVDGVGRDLLIRQGMELRSDEPDLVVVLPHTVDAALFAYATGAPIRVGHASQGRAFLLTRAAPNRKDVHEVERQLDLVRAVGVDPGSPPLPRVWPNARVREDAKRLLEGLAPDPGPVVALTIGARNPARRWSPARYAELVRQLAEERGACFVVLGTREDRAEAREIAGRLAEVAPNAGDRFHDLTGRTTLSEVAWLFDRVHLTVGSDSGLLHLAASRGCPVVGIYGPGDPVAWAPYGPGHSVVRLPMLCSPCANHVCRSVACIRGLPVEPVASEALARLG